MEEKITVAIAEDNQLVLETLMMIVQSEPSFELVGTSTSGKEAIELRREKNPDVMLLDVVMPEGGGLDVLSEARDDKGNVTKFIMISAIGDEKITRDAFSLGAAYYLMKPFTSRGVIGRIKLVKNQMRGVPEPVETTEQLVSRVLVTLGVPAQLNGYKYLREAISMVTRDPEEITSITKQIYPVLAEHYQVSAPSVERAIRHAIEVSWKRGNIEALDNMFGYTIDYNRGKPTNSEYIAMIADQIRMGYHG